MMEQLQDIADRAVRYASGKARYCDVRAESYSTGLIRIENGQIEHAVSEGDYGIGIRVLCGGAWGFGAVAGPRSFDEIKQHVDMAVKSAAYNSQKAGPVELAASYATRATESLPVAKKPDIDSLAKIALDLDHAITNTKNIAKSTIRPRYSEASKYFASSEGGSILQEFTDVTVHMAATGRDNGITQTVDITEGGRGGIEQLTENDKAYRSAEEIAARASDLLQASPAKKEEATVVMNPDFVALLTHEILGHPSEADRVLGREMAWAGGAWWAGMTGQSIGPECLNVFDDPTIHGSLGWYHYDDEGTESARTQLVRDGILERHMQSRETAALLGCAPTGSMRATSYMSMPLIRMACTCIDSGDYDPEEMIKGVKDGYYISNMKVPSIDMNRYNWSISCQYAHKIKDGQITDLHRDVIVSGTAPEFFASIDACGNDFTVRPVTNCGKGDPMQIMGMGNGGPTIRGKATVRSA